MKSGLESDYFATSQMFICENVSSAGVFSMNLTYVQPMRGAAIQALIQPCDFCHQSLISCYDHFQFKRRCIPLVF